MAFADRVLLLAVGSVTPAAACQGAPAGDGRSGHGVTGTVFGVSSYLGRDGLAPRSDLAGRNLSERPTALVECGNMHDAAEAALMSTSDGRQRYADAIADGVLAYLSLT